MKHRSDVPRPALTVDVGVVRGTDADREILLIRRGNEPFVGAWALPGGFVDEGEPPEQAARRELCEETGLTGVGRLTLAGAYGDPGRDPRGWTVSIVYLARAEGGPEPTAGDDAAEAAWYPAWDLPELAFDHETIVADLFRIARHTDRS